MYFEISSVVVNHGYSILPGVFGMIFQTGVGSTLAASICYIATQHTYTQVRSRRHITECRYPDFSQISEYLQPDFESIHSQISKCEQWKSSQTRVINPPLDFRFTSGPSTTRSNLVFIRIPAGHLGDPKWRAYQNWKWRGIA